MSDTPRMTPSARAAFLDRAHELLASDLAAHENALAAAHLIAHVQAADPFMYGLDERGVWHQLAVTPTAWGLEVRIAGWPDTTTTTRLGVFARLRPRPVPPSESLFDPLFRIDPPEPGPWRLIV